MAEETGSAAPAAAGELASKGSAVKSGEIPTGGASRNEPAPQEHMSAFERAKSRRGTGPASDSPAAGLSSGKTTIQKERGLAPAKSALEALKERSRKFNPSAKTVDNEIRADESAMPGKGPAEVERGGRVEREEEPEVEPLAPAPGETEIPEDAVSTPVGDHTPGEGVEPEEQVTEEVFTPSLKYKAFGQEHDIPERFRDLIKDPESEREVHQVFERAHAFDRFKANLTQLDSEVKTKLVPEIQFHRQTREQFNAMIQKGDVFGILGKMNIPRDKVLQAVAERIRIEQLPPEQKALYDATEVAQQSKEQAANQIQAMQQRVQQLESSAKHSSIQSTFARGDVRTVADDFDSRVGTQGSFYREVIQYGDYMYHQGRDITPEEAVQAVMQKFGLSYGTSQAAKGQVTTPVAPRAPAAQVRSGSTPQTRVLPNIASKSAAPTRGRVQVNSAEDIRKLSRQMRGR